MKLSKHNVPFFFFSNPQKLDLDIKRQHEIKLIASQLESFQIRSFEWARPSSSSDLGFLLQHVKTKNRHTHSATLLKLQ